MILFSFNDPAGRFNFTWQGFTLDTGSTRSRTRDPRDAMTQSLEIAALATIVATVLGTLMALALVRYGSAGAGATNLFIFLPMATPEIVLGASLLVPVPDRRLLTPASRRS